MNKFYITTSIPYLNANPHIGFALELIQADAIARHHAQKGDDVYFLTGTDEHGIKIAKAASDAGISPDEFTNTLAKKFKDLAKVLNISNNDFIRTTDQEKHWPSVKEAWLKLKENGDIYEKQYEGLYCVGCEAFKTKKELIDGLCPIHKKKPEEVKEKNWFFRLSKYGTQIQEALESGEIQIIPDARKHEIIEIIKEGLEDVSFSRPKEKLQWGIPVPIDNTQTIYVWADALVNYISALGYPNGENFKKYWPAQAHCVGKDIFRFHALIWPAMLLGLGLKFPEKIFVHGFITVGGEKMSKSLGNVIDPFQLVEKYGADAVRYFLLREIPATEDGDFTEEKFQKLYNSDLASGLGNLVARVLALATKNSNFQFSISSQFSNSNFQKLLAETKQGTESALENFQFGAALEAIWGLIHACDKYIEQERPWEQKENAKNVISDLLFVIGAIANLLSPFLPATSEKIIAQLKGENRENLFPRIEKA